MKKATIAAVLAVSGLAGCVAVPVYGGGGGYGGGGYYAPPPAVVVRPAISLGYYGGGYGGYRGGYYGRGRGW